ncbi:MAG: MFS transporter [Anaerolineales bacterium]|nr:MFS transporter [Anaerolineales bacterium]
MRLRFQLIIFTLIRAILNTMHRMVYPFLAVFARGLGVDISVITRLVANRSILGSLSPFLFPILEPRGRKFGILLGLSIFVFSMGMVFFWPSLTTLGLALILSLAAKSIFDPSLMAYLADHIPYKRRGTALAINEFAWSLAFILGVPAAGWMIARSTWSAPFSIMGLLGIAAIIFVAVTITDTARPVNHVDGIFGNVKAIITSPVVLTALSIGMLVSAANELVNLMFGVWLEDSFKLQIAALGAASAIIGFSELGGEGAVALFVDRIGKVRAAGIGIVANCIAAILLPIIGRTQLGALTGLFFFYITFEFTLVSIIPLMSEVMPSARATTLSFGGAAHSIGRAIGALLAPALYALGFSMVTGAAVFFNALGLIAVWYVAKHHD